MYDLLEDRRVWQTTPGSTQSPTALGDLTLLDAAGAATVYYEAGTDVVVRLVDADLVGHPEHRKGLF